ncbi:hypothetical protein ACFO5Q_06690 [Kordiimonas lipolytica]|uniref:Uncharacterized protein n=1 Tax=Kordiimonas lipolytica TaxID=1662421 RepID=A0ABV8UA46_9PROT|nr:hypothetical protein [Kordiimonas lipolytica]
MADSESPSPEDIAKMIDEGLKGTAEVEAAIQKSIVDFVEAADAEIQKLLKQNVVPPDVTMDMKKLQQTMIDKTIEIIKSNTPPTGSDTGSDSGGS